MAGEQGNKGILEEGGTRHNSIEHITGFQCEGECVLVGLDHSLAKI